MAMVTIVLGLSLLGARAASAQDYADPTRLHGVSSVAIRATAVWDAEITNSAGGATQDQFEEALRTGLHDAIAEAKPGPELDPAAEGSVLCHVDTFYDRGLIVYSVHVAYERPGADGQPVIAWLRSWVGSYTTQQLHVIWTISDQCADAFLKDWRTANPG